jgi:hypothetical protein
MWWALERQRLPVGGRCWAKYASSAHGSAATGAGVSAFHRVVLSIEPPAKVALHQTRVISDTFADHAFENGLSWHATSAGERLEVCFERCRQGIQRHPVGE